MAQEKCDIYIFGAGGHAAVVRDLVAATNPQHRIAGYVVRDSELESPSLSCRPLLAEDAFFLNPSGIAALGIGDNLAREQVLIRCLEVSASISMPCIIHPSSVIVPSATLRYGSVVMPGALIQSEARIGCGVVINSGVIIEHNCVIDDYVLIGSGSVLGGGVTVGYRSLIGVGCVVKPGVTIGADAVIGAGSVVIKDVEPGATVAGVPAKPI